MPEMSFETYPPEVGQMLEYPNGWFIADADDPIFGPALEIDMAEGYPRLLLPSRAQREAAGLSVEDTLRACPAFHGAPEGHDHILTGLRIGVQCGLFIHTDLLVHGEFWGACEEGWSEAEEMAQKGRALQAWLALQTDEEDNDA